MFRVLRYCYSCVVAGLIGMLAGMLGQIYIYEQTGGDGLCEALPLYVWFYERE